MPEENSVHLVDDDEANKFLNDLINYPHAYVLACMMDRQIKAEKAWIIPQLIKEEIGSFEIEVLAEKSLEDYIEIFNRLELHRFNDTMANVFFNGVHQKSPGTGEIDFTIKYVAISLYFISKSLIFGNIISIPQINFTIC